MSLIIPIVKYVFVAGVLVEVVLIIRSLVNLAREKAQVAAPTATQE